MPIEENSVLPMVQPVAHQFELLSDEEYSHQVDHVSSLIALNLVGYPHYPW
jgi:hypothetical protein